MSKAVVLRPLDVSRSPAPFPERVKLLGKVFEVVSRWKRSKLPKGKIELLSVKLENQVALTSISLQSYRFNINVLIRDLNKVKGDLKEIKIDGKFLIPRKTKFEDTTTNSGETTNVLVIADLNRSKIYELLKPLILTEENLVKESYITHKDVQEYELEMALKQQIVQDDTNRFETETVRPMVQYVLCARCNTKFQKNQILYPTTCNYHPSKRQYNRSNKEYSYSCCGETTASNSTDVLGCQKSNRHVFKETKYKDLIEISPFHDTKDVSLNDNKDCNKSERETAPNVLAIDCEMGFTDKGFEMIRITIIDFFNNETLYDKLVKPIGHIIDLNTQFSGVSLEDMEKGITFHECMDEILNNNLINQDTILIGHGLENDLNVMRVIHKKVIDTAVIYKKGKLKRSLKDLAFEILNRKIQTGEHDSSEDAIATMDIVKKRLGIQIDFKYEI